MTRIRIKTSEDLLFLQNDEIYAVVNGEEFVFSLSTVRRIFLLMAGPKPYCTDWGLAVEVDPDTAIFIMADHHCFKPFLFDQLGKVLPIDYQRVIDAMERPVGMVEIGSVNYSV